MRYRTLLLLPLIAWLYGAILARLFAQWINDPNFKHGIFVPAFALFVLWRDRKKLKAIETSPSWAGLPAVALALTMLILGVLGNEFFLSRLSLLILLAGLIILFQGWNFFRAVLFLWAFLILMIPLPLVILQEVVDPLQLAATKLAAALLYLVGVPLVREGYVIIFHMPLLVALAEGGIRSILSLLTVAIIYGYLADNRKWVRVVLGCSGVPIAVAANSFRILGTGLLIQYWDPDKAQGFFHLYSGWLIFVVALIMLFILHRLISRIWKSSPETKSSEQMPASATSTSVGRKDWSFRFGTAAVLMLVAVLVLQARSRGELLSPRESLSLLPMQIDGWAGHDIRLDQQTLDIFKPDDVLLRDYENASQRQPPINLYIEYSPTQVVGAMIHSEENDCLPGAGWVVTLRQIVQIERPDGSSFPANRDVVSKAGDRELELYWYQAHGRAVASPKWAKYYLVADSIRMNRSDGAMVRLMTPMSPGESPEAAQARLMKLGSHLLPTLDRYIPR